MDMNQDADALYANSMPVFLRAGRVILSDGGSSIWGRPYAGCNTIIIATVCMSVRAVSTVPRACVEGR